MNDILKELIKKKEAEPKPKPKPKPLWQGEEFSEIDKLIKGLVGEKPKEIGK